MSDEADQMLRLSYCFHHFSSYFLSVLSGLKQNLEFLDCFTPLKYFDAGELFNSGSWMVPTCFSQR